MTEQKPPLKTRIQVRQELIAKRITMTQLAKDNNWGREALYNVLRENSKAQCRWGQASEIAIALGLKEDPKDYPDKPA